MSLDLLKQKMEVLETEYTKFKGGNKSAGSRSRKALQEIKKLAQEIRIEILTDSKKGA